MYRTFNNFNEAEQSIIESVPQVIYKYRSDWNNKWHKSLITEQEMWFASPRELNDPFDIRIPVVFNFDEIDDPIFLEKLKSNLIMAERSTAFLDWEIENLAKNRLQKIRQNPEKFFTNAYSELRNSSIYDIIGVFSCTTNELSNTMWAHYGNNHSGFAIGFDTLELMRNLRVSVGYINYSDKIHSYSFIEDELEQLTTSCFQKSNEWSYEKEFRLINMRENLQTSKIRKYPKSCIKELILGMNFPDSQISSFIAEINAIFSNSIPIFQVKVQPSSFELFKDRLV